MAFYGIAPLSFGPVTAVTATRGTNDPELGTRRSEGANEYLYVYNDANSTIATAKGCVLQSGASGYSVTVSSVTSADMLIGVAVNSITTGAYGWVVTRGITSVLMGATSATVAAGDMLELAANGVFVPVSNTTGNKGNACGKALAAIVSSATGSAYITAF
jgi:hypothetical protein